MPDDFQYAIDLMAESVDHLKASRHHKEIIRAGMRAACEYALMKRAGFELTTTEKNAALTA